MGFLLSLPLWVSEVEAWATVMAREGEAWHTVLVRRG
jgi:hypothetical protein